MLVRDAIEQSYLAKGFTPAFIDKVVAISVEKNYATGDSIITEDDASTDLMILVSGKAEITKAGTDHISFIKPLMPLGEVAFIDGQRRSSSVIATEHCTVVVIDGDQLRALMQVNPEMAMVALHNLALVLCSRLRRANQEIAALHVDDEFGG